jgi:ABC-type microcin C transport system duplicated ATPase subunit YejF
VGLLANAESSDDVEAVNPELHDHAAVVIKRLKKTYKKSFGKKFAAVDGLNLTMYDGQITAFLGHNGAGMDKNQKGKIECRILMSSTWRYFGGREGQEGGVRLVRDIYSAFLQERQQQFLC